LSHVGAWAPMAEQKAVAKYLLQKENIQRYLQQFKAEIELRLRNIHDGFKALQQKGYSVDAIAPQAAIYLTIKLDLRGKTTAEGNILETQSDVTSYILAEAKLAVVPFSAFGAGAINPWYRLSVGTGKKEVIAQMQGELEAAVEALR